MGMVKGSTINVGERGMVGIVSDKVDESFQGFLIDDELKKIQCRLRQRSLTV